MTPIADLRALPPFEDERVQTVYRLLCDNTAPPDSDEHWEGWVSRRIIAALDRPRAQDWAKEASKVTVDNLPAPAEPSVTQQEWDALADANATIARVTESNARINTALAEPSAGQRAGLIEGLAGVGRGIQIAPMTVQQWCREAAAALAEAQAENSKLRIRLMNLMVEALDEDESATERQSRERAETAERTAQEAIALLRECKEDYVYVLYEHGEGPMVDKIHAFLAAHPQKKV